MSTASPPTVARFRLDRFFALTDMLALAVAYACAVALRFSAGLGPMVYGFVNGLLGWGGAADLSGSEQHMSYGVGALRYLLPFALALHGLYTLQGMYQEHRFLRPRPILWKVLVANVAILAGVIALLYFRKNQWHPRSFFVTVFLLNGGFCLLFRTLTRARVGHLWRTRVEWTTPTVLVGETPEAETVQGLVEGSHPHGLFIAARVPSPLSGDLTELARVVTSTAARLVIVADDQLPIATAMHILDLTARMNVAVKVLTHKLAVLQLKAGEDFDTIRGTPLVHFEAPSVSNKNAAWRCGLSRLLAATALVVLSPVLLVTALLIKMTDPGPIFFVQERFGVDRRPFRMFKFRTMRVDAEKLLALLEARNEAGGGLFKLKNDPRITPIGRFLRRYSIDELPQILNVLKGDMRIVGPRPLPKRDVNNYYEEWHYHRHNGRPGLTCLWQVSGRSEIDFENMCILDVYYLRNQTWALDLKIVARTVGVVLFGSGAY